MLRVFSRDLHHALLGRTKLAFQALAKVALLPRMPRGDYSPAERKVGWFAQCIRPLDALRIDWAAGTAPPPVLFLAFRPVSFGCRRPVPYKARTNW